MKDRKIIIALKNLSIYELNSFTKFVASPYFNSNKTISAYYALVEEAIKKNTIDRLKQEDVWSSLFPTERFHAQRFAKLNSDLLVLLELFIAQKEVEQSESLLANLKMIGAHKRNLSNIYNGIIQDVERLQKQEKNQSSHYYLNKYQIENNIFKLKTENEKKNERSEIVSGLNFSNISENLDFFYVIEKLRQFCVLLAWKKMYQIDIEFDNLQMVLEKAQQKPYNEVPAINLYYKMYLTYIEESNLDNYYELRNLIKKHSHLFSKQEQNEDIYSTALSYCINRVNKGDLSFQKETFLLYKEIIDNGILLEENILSHTYFRNIALIALRVNEFEWAENFIHNFAPYIEEKYRTTAVEFSLARLEFYKNNYSKVLEHLYKVNYEDVWYNVNAKTLQVACYYELNEFDALESLLQAFKMFIRREKSLTNDRKEHYLHLIKFTNNLMKIDAKDQDKVLKLKTAIVETKGIVSKPWLIEKVSALIKVK